MRKSYVEADEEAPSSSTSETPWAYVFSNYESPRGSKAPESSLLFSVFRCCFNDNTPSSPSQSDISEKCFNPVDNFPVTLSQALLCLDNPQIPNCQVSFPITEEIILAEHRCRNVLKKPCVTRSTQMLFMGYDAESLRKIDLCRDSYSRETITRIGDSS